MMEEVEEVDKVVKMMMEVNGGSDRSGDGRGDRSGDGR